MTLSEDKITTVATHSQDLVVASPLSLARVHNEPEAESELCYGMNHDSPISLDSIRPPHYLAKDIMLKSTEATLEQSETSESNVSDDKMYANVSTD